MEINNLNDIDSLGSKENTTAPMIAALRATMDKMASQLSRLRNVDCRAKHEGSLSNILVIAARIEREELRTYSKKIFSAELRLDPVSEQHEIVAIIHNINEYRKLVRRCRFKNIFEQSLEIYELVFKLPKTEFRRARDKQ